eukprot:7400751-Karenia_brevis.AAC.1
MEHAAPHGPPVIGGIRMLAAVGEEEPEENKWQTVGGKPKSKMPRVKGGRSNWKSVTLWSSFENDDDERPDEHDDVDD